MQRVGAREIRCALTDSQTEAMMRREEHPEWWACGSIVRTMEAKQWISERPASTTANGLPLTTTLTTERKIARTSVASVPRNRKPSTTSRRS